MLGTRVRPRNFPSHRKLLADCGSMAVLRSPEPVRQARPCAAAVAFRSLPKKLALRSVSLTAVRKIQRRQLHQSPDPVPVEEDGCEMGSRDLYLRPCRVTADTVGSVCRTCAILVCATCAQMVSCARGVRCARVRGDLSGLAS